MIINYFDKYELNTNDIKEKLDLIAKSPTENAKYISNMLLKTLVYLSQKEELNAPFLQEGYSFREEGIDAIVYFTNQYEDEIEFQHKVIRIGNQKTQLEKGYYHIQDRRKIRKALKDANKIVMGFNPEDIDYTNYFYSRTKVYFYNLFNELQKMPMDMMKEDVEKVCTYLLLEKSRFQSPIVRDKTKISLKKLVRVYSLFAEKLDHQQMNGKRLFYKPIQRTAYYTNMLNEMSLIADIFHSNSRKERTSKIYDVICDRMLKEAHSLGYCNFENNRCIASRYTDGFPNSKENGCCQNTYQDRGKDCRYLNKDYSCSICSISCRVFTCGYLQKRGIDHALFQYPLVDIGFGKIKKAEIIYDFFTPKEKMMKKLT